MVHYNVWLAGGIPETSKLTKPWRFLTLPGMLSHLVFGVLTILINILLAGLPYDVLHWNLYVASTLTWVASVTFIFFTNKLFVFQSENMAPAVLIRESMSFLGARLFSLGVDTLGMGLLADLLHWNFWVAKILMNMIVVALNYIFSKLLIFNQKK